MALIRSRQGGVRFLWLAMLLASAQPTVGQQNGLSPEELVGRLNHDSFSTRQSAAAALREAGLTEWMEERGQTAAKNNDAPVISALRSAAGHASLEVRLAAHRILHEISTAAHDAELQRLLNPHIEASNIRLEHWNAFARWGGEDMQARTAFASISKRLGNCNYARQGNENASDALEHLSSRLDPYWLDAEDTTAWMLLLLIDLEQRQTLPHLAPRIGVALSHSPMGPADSGSIQGEVLGRLIDRWIRQSGHFCGDRERLLIAMRYQRRDAARELCQRVLADDTAPAATTVTGLLVASVVGREDVQAQAARRLEDERVAYVAQLISSPKTKIRTEVRDVALALLLHHHGVDPRTAGFEQLEADPLLCYRDHSLGFPDEATRLESRRQAAQLLATQTDLVVAGQRD